jgi:predicted amidohydrolase
MKTLVAVAQMTSTDNKAHNLAICEELIAKAAHKGAQFLSFPENFAYFGDNREKTHAHAEALDGASITSLGNCAKKNNIWLSLGGFQELILGTQKIHNTHIVINNLGNLVSLYRKIHLFSANLSDKTHYDENKSVLAGTRAVCVKTPFFTAGLSICYDLRFANLFWSLRHQGAQVMLVPAAFTQLTGKAHWEILLRARAIETQSYVVAAAQIGEHNARRKTHGHAMIVDPWGHIIAECKEDQDLAFGVVDLNYLAKIREEMPVAKHRKNL